MRIQLFREEGFEILGLFTLILSFRYDNGYIVGYIDRNNAYGKTHAIMAQMQYLSCLLHPVSTTDANLWNTHMCISSEIVGHREWRFPVQQSDTGPATKMICICKHIHYLLLISMLWHKQAIFKSKRDKLSSSAECRIRTQGSQTPIHQQTECLLTNRLSYRGSSLKKLELDSPSLWSASIQPTRPYCQLAFAPGSGDMHICCC